MKFTIAWRIPLGSYQTAVEDFLSTGASVPSSLKAVGRWHTLGSNQGWYLVEEDPAAVAQQVAVWANRLELEVSPVLQDAEAVASLSEVCGSWDH